MFTIKRLPIANFHAIKDPYGSDTQDNMGIWANTLLKTRIPTLFRTIQGIEGHAKQIQCELNRLADVKDKPAATIVRAIEISKILRNALLKSQAAFAKSNPAYVPYWQRYHCL